MPSGQRALFGLARQIINLWWIKNSKGRQCPDRFAVGTLSSGDIKINRHKLSKHDFLQNPCEDKVLNKTLFTL
ncbi:hypothetical protein COV93_01970 [Candidatus Woesearchaeota archaeon CG11_big_fil_rev_8_21_14_0_20_43_8]|nr:MAG: hypothetical protein COV93_01970 [Candidatus Woesearchaeota archaeon CG11_big_fil_rev_8_21_14_0_20_43_8]PIO04680.1 MAG: hypothetical protein COT47_08030 [Candidatus Woesearchaeota archaeon CG08_land_8_20_14_0_20_43_7]